MGFMKKPKTPAVQMPAPLPPAPERSDAETETLAAEQRRRIAGRGTGRASTFLTAGGASEGASASRFLGTSSRS